MRVLVTRPAFLAEPLCQKLKTLGFIPDCFPVIEIVPTPYQSVLVEQLRQLPQADIAVFMSRSAAHYGAQAILCFWPQFPSILYAAIGPGTQQTLQQMGLEKVLIPAPPFESESLLNHPDFQILQGRNIVIFQGNAGRALLSQTFGERGAKVSTIECYQRRLPVVDLVTRQMEWRKNPVQVILLTSLEGLKNLVVLLGPRVWAAFQRLPMIVVGPRLREQAVNLGAQHIVTVSGADDVTLIQALLEIRKKIL